MLIDRFDNGSEEWMQSFQQRRHKTDDHDSEENRRHWAAN
jgi:hypothetical protein